MEKDIWIWS